MPRNYRSKKRSYKQKNPEVPELKNKLEDII